MSELYLRETKEYKGMTINVYFDSDPECPRDWDNLGTIYTNHRDYDFDNAKVDDLWRDFEYEVDREFATREDECKAFWKWMDEKYIWLQVSAYQHSGITIWVGDYHNHYDAQWDCGTFGIIAVSKEKVREEYGWKHITKERRAKIVECLTNEVKTLDRYFTGEVYGFRTEDEEGDEFDSYWGYYDLEQLYDEAKDIIDHHIQRREERAKESFRKALAEHLQLRKAQIRHHAPLYVRKAFSY